MCGVWCVVLCVLVSGVWCYGVIDFGVRWIDFGMGWLSINVWAYEVKVKFNFKSENLELEVAYSVYYVLFDSISCSYFYLFSVMF